MSGLPLAWASRIAVIGRQNMVAGPPGRARSIYVERSGSNYTDREQLLLSLLRPHFVRMLASAQFRRRSALDHGLTAREAEVLGWIAHGTTNAEIARLLFISPHTVRKHVENIFDKLHVRTRTAAAACMRQDHGWRPTPD